MSALKSLIVAEAKAVGFKETDMNNKLFEAIAEAVTKYLNTNVKANVSGGSSAGQHSLVAS